MVNELDKNQIDDASIVEEDELSSKGLAGTPFQSGLSISSVVSATKIITLSSGDLEEPRVQENDIIDITSGVAIGKYTVDEVLDLLEVRVKETILDAASGTMDIYYRSGARQTGVDNSNNDFDHDNMQECLEEIDFRQVVKEPTGYLNREQCLMYFDKTLRRFTIEPNVAGGYNSFVYYIRGHRFEKSSIQTVDITDTEGLWFIHFSGDTLVATQTPWDFEQEVAFTCVIYWSAALQKHVLFGEERHGLVMDWATHKRLHSVVGTQIESGNFELGNYIFRGDGSLDSHVQFSVGEGYLHDEDLVMHVTNNPAPSGEFEQILSPIAYVPIAYKTAGGLPSKWESIAATNIPVAYNATGLQYNHYDELTDTWSVENVTDGWYTTYWLIATHNVYEPLAMIMGQSQAPDAISSSQEQSVREFLAGFTTLELVPLVKLIYHHSSSYTNAAKAALYDIVDITDINLDFDRYNFTANYGANAGTGRYLEVFPGVSSDEGPFTFPENSFVRTITFRSSALNTGKIGFFDLNDLVNPVFEITLANTDKQTFVLTEFFLANTELAVRVTQGSFNKPNLRIFIQTQLN